MTNTDLEEALMGPSAERLYRFLRHIGCKQCAKAPTNEAISIAKLKEDAKFEGMVKIDEQTNRIVCSYPLPSSYRSLLSNNKLAAARRLQKEFSKLSKLEVSKGQVAKTWKKCHSIWSVS